MSRKPQSEGRIVENTFHPKNETMLIKLFGWVSTSQVKAKQKTFFQHLLPFSVFSCSHGPKVPCYEQNICEPEKAHLKKQY